MQYYRGGMYGHKMAVRANEDSVGKEMPTLTGFPVYARAQAPHILEYIHIPILRLNNFSL